MASVLARLSDLVFKGIPSLLRPRLGARSSLVSSPAAGSGFHGTAWGGEWSEDRHEQVRHYKHWVYVAVSKIASAVAMNQPNVSFVRSRDSEVRDRSRLLGKGARARAITPLLSHEQIEQVRPEHPLLRLLLDPNDPDVSFGFFQEMILYLELTGDCYLWAPPGPGGRPQALWVLPTHWTRPRRGPSGAIEWYELAPLEGGYARVLIPREDVIHLPFKSPISKTEGYSPLSAGDRWIDTQESIDKSRWASFRNGIFPGVSVEFDAGMKLPDEKDLDRIETRLMQRYGGEHNANKPLLVPPGAKVRKLQLSPSELMFVESADQVRDSVLALFGVPATVAQVNSSMTYGSVLAAQSSFYSLTLNPLFRFLGQVLTEKLAWRFDKGLRIWWEDRTPQDPELLEKQLATDLAYGARTMNEVRSLRGLEPYAEPWGNEPWIPLNTLPISEALARSREDASRGGSPGKNRATQGDPRNIASGEE